MNMTLFIRRVILSIGVALPVGLMANLSLADGPVTTNPGDTEDNWSPLMRTVISPINGDTVLLIRKLETPTEAHYEVAKHVRNPNDTMCDLYSVCILYRE